MRSPWLQIILFATSGWQTVSAAAVAPKNCLAPDLPPSPAGVRRLKPITLEQALQGAKQDTGHTTHFKLKHDSQKDVVNNAGCSNPSVRVEWDNLSASDRDNFVAAVQCLMNRPASGNWPAAKSRYEDLVALHQAVTPDVHGNAKFLVWHRYLLASFESIMRTECGFTAPLPWFDEEKWPGTFAQSSLFSSDWLGGISINGACVTDGKFAGHTLYLGPGTANTPHCLSRNGNAGLEADSSSSFVAACNARASYADMADCSERGPHNNGHNGVGGTMRDLYTSPGDPFFWLHHGFIDRNYRLWQNADASRLSAVGGNDAAGNPLTPESPITLNGLRPDVTVRDVLDTMGGALCYRYDY